MSATARLSLRTEHGNLVLEAQPIIFVRFVAGGFGLLSLVILSINFFSLPHALISVVPAGVSAALIATIGAGQQTKIDLTHRCISWSRKGIFGWKVVRSQSFGPNASAIVTTSYNSDGPDFVHMKLQHDGGEPLTLLLYTDSGYRDQKQALVDRINAAMSRSRAEPES